MIKKIGNLKGILVYILVFVCIANLALSVFPAPKAQQESNTQLLIWPDNIKVSLGENLTLTVNVTNVQKLYTWQVVLIYNGSILNCTDIWLPEHNVFAGHVMATVKPLIDKDYVTNLDFLIFGASLIVDSVDVSNGILFKANFTAVGSGATQIIVATEDNPARRSQFASFYSFLLNYDLDEIPYSCNYGVVLVGAEVNLPPVADFTAFVPEFDLSNYIVLKGYAPVGSGVEYIFAYEGFPVIFNASASYDPDGNVTLYIWDFGDGNVTETESPVIIHVFNSTGRKTVTLTVVDDGDPPASSKPRSLIVVVGLLLERFDWRPYLYGLVSVIVAAAAVIQSIRKVWKARKARLKKTE